VDDPFGGAAGPEVVGPQPDLAVVAALVAPLRAAEAGRGGMGPPPAGRGGAAPPRQAPAGLGRQPQLGSDLRAVEVGGQEVAGHGLPAQRLEGADLLGEDRVPGEDRHPVLAGELAEAPGVLRAADGAVAVEVEAAGDTGVDG